MPIVTTIVEKIGGFFGDFLDLFRGGASDVLGDIGGGLGRTAGNTFTAGIGSGLGEDIGGSIGNLVGSGIDKITGLFSGSGESFFNPTTTGDTMPIGNLFDDVQSGDWGSVIGDVTGIFGGGGETATVPPAATNTNQVITLPTGNTQTTQNSAGALPSVVDIFATNTAVSAVAARQVWAWLRKYGPAIYITALRFGIGAAATAIGQSEEITRKILLAFLVRAKRRRRRRGITYRDIRTTRRTMRRIHSMQKLIATSCHKRK